ncbi:hypothetical protein HPB51_017714 [Rhipicephalus microplus]|uniref:Uncharacterized protein n=1 Tax=Rhipicephalus microplus TaxID=6941 RepID=A0A9J6E2M8_RHIMP|nr:hypothetical protein HPB51_017714 [Rhipicephalus microplus]
MRDLKEKLDDLISEKTWEGDEVFEHHYSDATVVDCIVYYVTGFESRKLATQTSCTICKEVLVGQKGILKLPEADLVNCKTRGGLTHPNVHLFLLFKEAEEHFAKHAGERDVYESHDRCSARKFQLHVSRCCSQRTSSCQAIALLCVPTHVAILQAGKE